MNKAQEFLIKRKYHDIVIGGTNQIDPDKWVYVSDAIMEFVKGGTMTEIEHHEHGIKLQKEARAILEIHHEKNINRIEAAIRYHKAEIERLSQPS